MSEEKVKGLGELTENWSDKDKNWLNVHVPGNLRTIAARHGRELFSLVMQAGAATHVLTVLHSNVKHPELQSMLRNLTKMMDSLCQKAIKGEGLTLQQFVECKRDVERMAVLQDSGNRLPGDRVSKGGIILDS